MSEKMASDTRQDSFEPVTVDTEEVRISKEADWHNEEAIKVSYTIEPLTDEPVELRLVEQVPAGLVEKVEFHPAYDPKRWTRDTDDQLIYDTTIYPEDKRVTVYGFMAGDSAELSWLGEAPTVDVSEVELAGYSRADEDLSRMSDSESEDEDVGLEFADSEPADVSNAPEGRADPGSAAGQSDGSDSSAADGSVATAKGGSEGLAEGDFYRGGSSSTASEQAFSADPEHAGPGSGPSPQPESTSADTQDRQPGARSLDADLVVDALLDAIESGDIDETDLETLRETLGAPDAASNLEPQVEDLRDDVDELERVRTSVEELRDDLGGLSGIPDKVDDLREEIDEFASFRATVEDLRSTIDDLASLRDAIEVHTGPDQDASGLFEEVLTELETAEQERERLAADVDGMAEVGERLDSIEASMSSLEDRIESLGETLRSLEERQERDIGRLDDRVENLETREQALESEMASVRATVQEERQWRDQLSEALRRDTSDEESGADLFEDEPDSKEAVETSAEDESDEISAF